MHSVHNYILVLTTFFGTGVSMSVLIYDVHVLCGETVKETSGLSYISTKLLTIVKHANTSIHFSSLLHSASL